MDKHSEEPEEIKYVSSVYAENLFGSFNYDLQAADENWVDRSKLIILYGDNGSGKTTILKLLFNILSANKSRGQKSFVAKTPFKKIEIGLSDGTQVIVERTKRELTGAFLMTLITRNQSDRCFFATDSNGSVPSDNPKISLFLELLSSLKLNLYFLGDNREIVSNLFTEDDEPTSYTWIKTSTYALDKSSVIKKQRNDYELDINKTIENLVQWVRTKALEGSNAGEANVNTIYTNIIRSISQPSHNSDQKVLISAEGFIDILEKQTKRNEKFATYGLTSRLNLSEIILLLKEIDTTRFGVMQTILKPYIDGIEVRLNALERIQDLISTFVNTLNSFYTNKKIFFHLSSGLSVLMNNEEPLDPDQLSSGEKQLLLLFCNVLVAQFQNSVFLIDEPELSLNIKWQRNIITGLLNCIKGGRMQLIMATHSIELLSQYNSNVVELVSRNARSVS